jgi:hypothetical protein
MMINWLELHPSLYIVIYYWWFPQSTSEKYLDMSLDGNSFFTSPVAFTAQMTTVRTSDPMYDICKVWSFHGGEVSYCGILRYGNML